jgi:hypothetical protein
MERTTIMENREAKPDQPQETIGAELTNLHNEFAEFNNRCTFLWDTFSALAAEENALDTSTIEGLRCLADWMKQRMAVVQGRLKEIQERFAEEPPTSNRELE